MAGAKIPYAYILKEDFRSKIRLCDLKYSKYVVAHKKEIMRHQVNIFKDLGLIDFNSIPFLTQKQNALIQESLSCLPMH